MLEFVINKTQENISVSVVTEGRLAIASADRIIPGCWNVSRVNVPQEHRRRGIGSHLIQALIQRLRRDPSEHDQYLFVHPGGYGESLEEQINFYKRNGFKEGVPPVLMRWLKELGTYPRQNTYFVHI